MSTGLQTDGLVGGATLPENLRKGIASSNIPALDGLRAVAVFLVIFYHFGFSRVPGGLGVLAFFVLSGFLITLLLLKENNKGGNISLSNFYMRRVLRIFPAFYVYWFAVAGLLVLTGRAVPWRHAFSAFVYLGDYYNAIVRPPDSFVSHTWSLAIEEQFYLLWPTLLYAFRRDVVRLTHVLVGLIGFVWVYRVFLELVVRVDQSYIYNAFDARLDHLLIGCLLAVLLERGVLASLWQFLCSKVYFPGVTLALLIGSVFLEELHGNRYRDLVGFMLNPILVAILLVQMVNFSTSAPWKGINWSWVRYLGRISYSLYLYQQMTLYPARRILAGQPLFVQLLAAVAGTVVVASGSYFLIERPFLGLKSKFSSSSRPETIEVRPPRGAQAELNRTMCKAQPEPNPVVLVGGNAHRLT